VHTETTLEVCEYDTLRAGGMITIEDVHVVRRKFCSRKRIERYGEPFEPFKIYGKKGI
jgi:hypothetical protein